MHLTTRSLGLALLLLLLFLGAALTLQWWVTQETRHLQTVETDELRARLVHAIAVSGRAPERWDKAFAEELGAMVGGTVEFFQNNPRPAAPRIANTIDFVADLPAPGWHLHVAYAPPALLRLQVLHERTLSVMVLLALLLALVPLFAVALEARQPPPAEDSGRNPRTAAAGFTELARLSHERTTALAQEQGARRRAEEDLQVNRVLLGDSVAERVRLGRELHDNICQTLYAVCLTLESVQKKSALAPEMKQRVDQCLDELKRLNQEVRAYLRDLEPARVQGQSFAAAVTTMIGSLPSGDGVAIEPRLDEDAVALIPPHQVAEIMNILREALSNSLRHGAARHIVLRAGCNEQEIALAVQDDGAGFAPNGGAGQHGHGLDNMQARARNLGGSLRIDSTPGKGTRVLLTLPVASPA